MMSRKGYPSDKQDQFMLRLPDGMRDRIKAAAEENLRSMNAEIVARLEASFVTNHADAMQSPDAGRILESIFAYLAADGWTPPSREVVKKQALRIKDDALHKKATGNNSSDD